MKGFDYMLKAIKSAVAFLMAFLMSFSPVGSTENAKSEVANSTYTVSGAENLNADATDSYPVVIVPGINHSVTYLCDENGNVKTDSKGNQIGGPLLYFNEDEIKKEVPKMIVPLLKMLITQKDNGFTDKVYELCKKAFSVQATDDNGNNINNIVTKKFDYPISKMSEEDKEWVYRMIPMQKLTDEIGEDSVYFFTFNLFGNVMDSARELDEYIQFVKKSTGKDKVTLHFL